MIPLLHAFTGSRVLVFGGGRVGARKARHFARQADVVVVSPNFAPAEFGTANRIRARPGPEAVAGWIERTQPMLVVAATDDPALNARIEAETRDRGILMNRADRSDNHEPGDVIVPATYRDDPVIIAVATGGQSPALSGYLREQLTTEFAGAGAIAEVISEMRSQLKRDGVASETRHAVLRRLAADERVWAAAQGAGDIAGTAEQCLAEHLSSLRSVDEDTEH